MSFPLRCHNCTAFVGEARQPMEMVGVFRRPHERERIEGPRDTWRCGKCGWTTVFQPVEETVPAWRTIETKR